MAVETLELIVKTSGTSAAAQSLNTIASSSTQATRQLHGMNDTLRLMRNTLVALSFLRVFEGLASGINQMQQINALLSTVTRNTNESYYLFQKLAGAASDVRAPVEDFAKLFTNLTRSTAGYKLSTDEAIRATQTFFATFAISGLDTQSIRNVTRDMKEVFNQGIVQGRIFRSVVMQDQEEAIILSKYLVATGKNAAAVNKYMDDMRKQGKVPNIYEMVVGGQARGSFTAQDVVTANLKASAEEMGRLSGMAMTFGQAMTILNNKWLQFMSYIQQSTGLFATISGWIAKIGDYIPEIVLAAGAIGSLLVINLVASAFSRFGGLVSGIFTFIMTPIRAVVGAVFSLGGSIMSLGGTVISTFMGGIRGLMTGIFALARMATGGLAGLGEGIAEIGKMAISVGASILQFGVGLATAALVAIPAATILTAAWMTIQKVITDLTPTFNTLIGKAQKLGLTAKDIPLLVETGFSDIFANWPQYQAMFKALWDYVGTTFEASIAKAFNWVITEGAPALVKGVSAAIWNTGVDLGNWTRRQLGMSGPGGLGYAGVLDPGKQAAEQARELASLQGLLSTIGTRVITQTADLKAKIAAASAHGGSGAAGDDIGKVKDLTEKIRAAKDGLAGLLGGYDGLWGKFAKDWQKATDDIAKWTKTLGAAYVASQLAAYGFKDMNALQLAMIDKVLGVKDASKDYADTQRLVNKAIALGSTHLREYNDLLTEKLLLVAKENHTVAGGVAVAAIQNQQTLANPNPAASATVTAALKDSVALQTYTVGVQALTQAYRANIIDQDHFQTGLRDLQIEFLKTKTDAASGFVQGMLEVQKSMEDVATVAASAVQNAFKSLNDTLVTFFTTGKLNIKAWADSVLADFTRVAVQSQITGPLSNLLGFGAGQTSGGSTATNFLSQLFGGSGALPGLGGTGQLGTLSNPMYTIMVGPGGQLSSALSMPTGTASGGTDMFSSGGIFSSSGFFANLFNGTGGGTGSASSGILSALGSIGGFLGFASGGEFDVGGSPGTDSNIVAFRASADEHVSVTTPAQRRAQQNNAAAGKTEMHLHLHGVSDADSFKKSKSQIAVSMGQLADAHRRRNGA